MSPTQRTRAWCKSHGWHSAIVEKWNMHAKVRQDMFGFIDLVVLDGQSGPLGVQATSGDNVAARLTKAIALPELRHWLLSGARFEVWGWRKVGPRGKRKLWEVRRVPVTLSDLPLDASPSAA